MLEVKGRRLKQKCFFSLFAQFFDSTLSLSFPAPTTLITSCAILGKFPLWEKYEYKLVQSIGMHFNDFCLVCF